MAIGDPFILHTLGGVLTLRIEREKETHDGLMILTGKVLEGIEHYCDGNGIFLSSRDLTDETVSAWVTKDDWLRGTNVPQMQPVNRLDRH